MANNNLSDNPQRDNQLVPASVVAEPAEPAEPAESAESATPRIGDRVQKLLENPWAITASLFLVFAICGVPLIWVTKAYPTWVKILLTILVTLYTVLLLWGFWLLMMWSYHRITNAL